jgi:hypothetical protein
MRRRSGETFLLCFERFMTLLRLPNEADCLIWQHTKQRNAAPAPDLLGAYNEATPTARAV